MPPQLLILLYEEDLLLPVVVLLQNCRCKMFFENTFSILYASLIHMSNEITHTCCKIASNILFIEPFMTIINKISFQLLKFLLSLVPSIIQAYLTSIK